jgi:hypothetical protein
MNKYLLVALLLIPFTGISQSKKSIDGFLGIKFGSSRASVIIALKAKGGILSLKESSADWVYFKNLKLGHRAAGAFIVKFIDNKAYEGDFLFDPGADAHTLEYYFSLVNDINESYGTGDLRKNFKDPYNDKDEDDIKISAIKNGNAEYVTYWQSENKNTIAASIDEGLAVLLTYQDETLTGEAVKRQKTKDKADY